MNDRELYHICICLLSHLNYSWKWHAFVITVLVAKKTFPIWPLTPIIIDSLFSGLPQRGAWSSSSLLLQLTWTKWRSPLSGPGDVNISTGSLSRSNESLCEVKLHPVCVRSCLSCSPLSRSTYQSSPAQLYIYCIWCTVDWMHLWDCL